MIQRLTTKALLALACCMLLVLPVSTAWGQQGVWEGAKKGVQKGAEGVKKGAETAIDKTEDVGEAVGKGIKKGVGTAIDKTEDVGEAVGKGVKGLFTDDDRDSDATEPQQRSKTRTMPSDTESNTSITSQASETETASRELPATAGEQPLLVLIGALALVSAAALKVFRRVPNS